MDRRRTVVAIAMGAAVLAAVFAFGRKPRSTAPPREPATTAHAPTREPIPIHRPEVAVVEIGVMSDKPEKELATVADLAAATALLTSKHCGDAPACDAVKAFARGEDHVSFEVRDAPGWRMPRASDLASAASSLSPPERERFAKSPRVIIVTARGKAAPDQLPLRTGLAIAAAVAEKLQAFVYDPALDRVETAAGFVQHAVTEPLGASAFRRDRIDFQYIPRDTTHARALSAGMLRYGAPDLEIQSAPKAMLPRAVDVLAAVAAKVADGAATSPIAIGIADLDRVRDAGARTDGGDGAATLDIDLLAIRPENGDPNDFMARLVPPEGATTEGYEGMVDSLFGPSERAGEAWEPPSPEEFRATRARAQAALPNVLARWKAARADAGGAAELYVQLPFAPPDAAPFKVDASDVTAFEWTWIEVTSSDDASITGKLVDDPEDVPSLGKGDTVTRRRDEVSDYLLKLPDGTTETGSVRE